MTRIYLLLLAVTLMGCGEEAKTVAAPPAPPSNYKVICPFADEYGNVLLEIHDKKNKTTHLVLRHRNGSYQDHTESMVKLESRKDD